MRGMIIYFCFVAHQKFQSFYASILMSTNSFQKRKEKERKKRKYPNGNELEQTRERQGDKKKTVGITNLT